SRALLGHGTAKILQPRAYVLLPVFVVPIRWRTRQPQFGKAYLLSKGAERLLRRAGIAGVYRRRQLANAAAGIKTMRYPQLRQRILHGAARRFGHLLQRIAG